MLASLLEEAARIAFDEPPRDQVRARHHRAGGALHGEHDDDHAVLGQLLTVAEDHVVGFLDAQAVDVDVAGADPLAGAADAVRIDLHDSAVVHGHHPVGGNPHRPCQLGVQRQVTVLAVHGHEVPRPGQREEQLQLFA